MSHRKCQLMSLVSLFPVQGSHNFITVWCVNSPWKYCIWNTFLNLKRGAGVCSHLHYVCHRVCAPQSKTAQHQTASPRRQHSFVHFWLCFLLISWILGTVVGQMSTVTITRLFWVLWLLGLVSKELAALLPLSVPFWDTAVPSTTFLRGEASFSIILHIECFLPDGTALSQ